VRVRRVVVAKAGELLARWLAPPASLSFAAASSFAAALPVAPLLLASAPLNVQLEGPLRKSGHDPVARELRSYTMGVLALPPLARLIEAYLNHTSAELDRLSATHSLTAAQVTTTVRLC
jgi:hypothetical protein